MNRVSIPPVRRLAKRTFDVLASGIALLLILPLFPIISLGIVLSSKGDVFFRSERVGVDGGSFTMHKFRTMHVGNDSGSRITSGVDARVFGFGRVLRVSKLDELPQFWDVFRGKMSIVGPRPEDRSIVDNHYCDTWWDTLRVKPGLTSPGSLYYYTDSEDRIPDDDAERYYLRHILPRKIEIDRYYVHNASFWYDLQLCFRTAALVIQRMFGRRNFAEIPEVSLSNSPKR